MAETERDDEGTGEEEDTSYSLNEGGTSRQAGATHTYYPENNNIRVSIYMSFRRQVGPGWLASTFRLLVSEGKFSRGCSNG